MADDVKINLTDPHVEQTLEKLMRLVDARKIPTLDEDDVIILKMVAATIRSIKSAIRIFGYFGMPVKAAMGLAGIYLFIKDKGILDTLKELGKGIFLK